MVLQVFMIFHMIFIYFILPFLLASFPFLTLRYRIQTINVTVKNISNPFTRSLLYLINQFIQLLYKNQIDFFFFMVTVAQGACSRGKLNYLDGGEADPKSIVIIVSHELQTCT